MAYKALYRTYRPTTFKEVAGQKVIVSTLQNAIDQNKIAHAYLFCGPRGTGKTSIAKIFAKAINCTGDHPPCGVCDNCIAMQHGNHPDVIEIDAASNNGVDEVRELIEKVKYAPIEGKYKVYIIDEVHMMTTGAFNALLKTIEEPPEHVIFILATTEPHKVLPTILSRCQRFDFTKVELVDMVNKLEEVCIKENKKTEEGALRLICQLADGGMRDALSILDQCLAYADDFLTLEAIYEVYGIVSTEEKVAFLIELFKGNSLHSMETIEDYITRGVDLKRITNDFIAIIKDSIIFENTNVERLLKNIDESQAKALKQVAKATRRLQAIDVLLETLQKYSYSSNVAAYFEISILKLLDLKESQVVVLPQETQNVSRETSKGEALAETSKEGPAQKTEAKEPVVEPKVEKKPSVMPTITTTFDDEYILRLLVSANKSIREELEAELVHLPTYMTDMRFARFVNHLQMMQLLAAGTNYLLFKTKNQLVANQYNEISKLPEHQQLMKNLFGSGKHVFVVGDEQATRTINEFKTRAKEQRLPDRIVLEDIELDDDLQNDRSKKDLVIDLFGSENVTFKED